MHQRGALILYWTLREKLSSGNPNNGFVTVLCSKDVNILCGLGNNTRQQTTHTISATNWSLRVLVYTYKVNHTFLKFLKCDADEPIQYFWNFQKEETSLKFPSQWEKKSKERMWCRSIFKYKYSKSSRNAKLY